MVMGSWFVHSGGGSDPAPDLLHVRLKLGTEVLLECALFGLNLKAIHVRDECWK